MPCVAPQRPIPATIDFPSLCVPAWAFAPGHTLPLPEEKGINLPCAPGTWNGTASHRASVLSLGRSLSPRQSQAACSSPVLFLFCFLFFPFFFFAFLHNDAGLASHRVSWGCSSLEAGQPHLFPPRDTLDAVYLRYLQTLLRWRPWFLHQPACAQAVPGGE